MVPENLGDFCNGYFLKREGKSHVYDLHATFLSLLGLDHEGFSYLFQGWDRRLTGVGEYNDLLDRLLQRN